MYPTGCGPHGKISKLIEPAPFTALDVAGGSVSG